MAHWPQGENVNINIGVAPRVLIVTEDYQGRRRLHAARRNKVPTVGLNYFGDILRDQTGLGTLGSSNQGWLVVGTNTAAPAAGDTAATITETSRQDITIVSNGMPIASWRDTGLFVVRKFDVTTHIPSSTSIAEVGLVANGSASANSGTLVGRSTFTGVTINATMARIYVAWVLEFRLAGSAIVVNGLDLAKGYEMVFTSTGLRQLRDMIKGDVAQGNGVSHLGIGTGTVLANLGDGDISDPSGNRVAVGSSISTGDVTFTISTIASGSGYGEIAEGGLFDQAGTGTPKRGGICFARWTHDPGDNAVYSYDAEIHCIFTDV